MYIQFYNMELENLQTFGNLGEDLHTMDTRKISRYHLKILLN